MPSAQALSLGSPEGAAVLGRPLDVVVSVKLDNDMAWDSACIQAEMMQGADRGPGIPLMVNPLGNASQGQLRVRVRSHAEVVEPIVELRLSAGCDFRLSRDYTLLADPPVVATPAKVAAPRAVAIPRPKAEASAPSTAREKPAAIKAAAPKADRAMSAAARPSTPRMDKPVEQERAKPNAATANLAGESALSSAVGAAAQGGSPSVTPASRLQLEPAEHWLREGASDAPGLQSEPQLMEIPSAASSAEREQAAIIQAHVAQIQGLQAEIERLQDQVKKDRETSAVLQKRLQHIESDHVSSAWLWALLGVLVLALAALAGISWRLRKAEEAPWYELKDRPLLDEKTAEDKPEPAKAAKDVQEPLPATVHAGIDVIEEEDELLFTPVDDTESISPNPRPQQPDTQDTEPLPDLDFVAPQPIVAAPWADKSAKAGVLRPGVGNTQHLTDPRIADDLLQQVEFFTSIGEHEQAIGMLLQHIADHEYASPSIYLESLQLYHSLSRTQEFARLSAQFERRFNVKVPEFAAFGVQVTGLLDLPQVLDPLVAAWRTSDVESMIEARIFRSDAPSEEGVSPDALMDLLMLYTVARQVPLAQRGLGGDHWPTTRAEPALPDAEEVAANDQPVAMTPQSVYILENPDALDFEPILDAPVTAADVPPEPSLDFSMPLDLPQAPVTSPMVERPHEFPEMARSEPASVSMEPGEASTSAPLLEDFPFDIAPPAPTMPLAAKEVPFGVVKAMSPSMLEEPEWMLDLRLEPAPPPQEASNDGLSSTQPGPVSPVPKPSMN